MSEGDRVRAGQTLVEIDSRDAAVQIRRAEAGESEAREALAVLDQEIAAAEFGRAAAEANRKLAASTLDRYRTLHDRRSVSEQEFDEVQAKLSAATAETERANAMLESAKARRKQTLARIDQATVEKSGADLSMDYNHVVSPVNGIVTARTIEAGMIASPGVPLLTVEDDAAYRFEAQVTESLIGIVRMGDAVRIELEAPTRDGIQGRVSEIVPSADPLTRSNTVKIDLPKAASIRSGLFGRAYFASGERSVISIPRELVVQHGQLTSVYVLDEQNRAPTADQARQNAGRSRGSTFGPARRGPSDRGATRNACRRYGGSAMSDRRLGIAGTIARTFIDSRLTPLIVIASLLLGVGAILLLPREEEPQIIVPMVDVFVQMPGATPKEIEERVTRPMEKLIWEIPGRRVCLLDQQPGIGHGRGSLQGRRKRGERHCPPEPEAVCQRGPDPSRRIGSAD